MTLQDASIAYQEALEAHRRRPEDPDLAQVVQTARDALTRLWVEHVLA